MGAVPPTLIPMGISASLLAVRSQVMGTPHLLRRGAGWAIHGVQARPVHRDLQGPGRRAALRGPDEPMDLSFLGTSP